MKNLILDQFTYTKRVMNWTAQRKTQGFWRLVQFFIVILICLIQTSIFYKNSFNLVEKDFFSNFQKDSEALVVGKIVFDKNHPNVKEKANLGFSTSDRFSSDLKHILEGYDLLNVDKNQKLNFFPYTSQVGLQGLVYSFLYNNLKIRQIESLNYLCALLTSISLVFLTLGFCKTIGSGFALAFLVSVSFSPWMISFARNLYWSPFLWFSPAVFSMLAYFYINHFQKNVFLFLFFISIFIKCLCGYEYISTIIWFSCAIFLIDPFLISPRLNRTSSLRYASITFGLAVSGFLAAILVHSTFRGNTVFEGLTAIWNQDVKRRTYGSPSSFDPVSAASLNASLISVLKTYIKSWSTDLIYRIHGKRFILLNSTALATIGYKFFTQHRSRWRDFSFFVVYVFGPLSWFCLAKGHSYVHVHMNYIMWYFGFVAVLIYISTNGAFLLSIKGLRFLHGIYAFFIFSNSSISERGKSRKYS
ncbi:MAG: hypothetical protein ACO3A2_05180 [Bdellovibrionia bacterium]